MCGSGGGSSSVKPTAAENEQAKVALQKYNLSRELSYVRDQYRDSVDQLDSSNARSAMAGRANVAAQAVNSQAAQNIAASNRSAGIDPSSGRGLAATTSVAGAAGANTGRAQSESLFALKTAALQGKENSIAQALGQETRATAGLQDIAAQSVQNAANNAYGAFNSRAATSSALGSVAGAGLSSYLNQEQ
jgi:hypothetical protein